MHISKGYITPLNFYRFMTEGAIKSLKVKTIGQSLTTFAKFAMDNKRVSHLLWSRLIEFNPQQHVKYVFFPTSLLEKPEIVSKINKIPIEKLVTERHMRGKIVPVLDFGRLENLVRALGPKGIKDEEIENLSVLLELSRLYFKQYYFSLRKGVAKRGGDEFEKELYQSNIEELMREIPWLITILESVNKPYRKEIVQHLRDAKRLHEEKNESAVTTCLITAWKKLEAKIDEMEANRLKNREKEKNERLNKIIKRSVLNLEYFGIKRLPDGTWIIPGKGYRKMSGVYVKEERHSKVKEEDVLRRTQDIIQSISKELEKNSKNILILSQAMDMLKKYENDVYSIPEGEKESIKSMLYSPLYDYSKAIKRKKIWASNRLEMTLGLIDGFLFKHAISMIRMAIDDLEDRNFELLGQKAWFEKLGKVEAEEIVRQIKKEEDLRKKIRWAVRIFSTWKVSNFIRISGTAKWVENSLIKPTDDFVEIGFKNVKKCFTEAKKALKQAYNWSRRDPEWIKHQGIPMDKLNEIADNNTRNNIIKAAKWLIIADWCIVNKYEKEKEVKELANLWKKLAEPNKHIIESIKKIK